MSAIDYRKEDFVYLQIGAHGSFNVFDADPIPAVRDGYGENWRVFVTEPDYTKYLQIKNRFAGWNEMHFHNVGINSNVNAKHYSIDNRVNIEEENTVSYDLFIGPKHEGHFTTLPELFVTRDAIMKKFEDVFWITQIASYNWNSVLSPNHTSSFSNLADYVVETPNLTTWTTGQLVNNLSLTHIDMLQICQSGDDYDIVMNFPFSTISPRYLSFKILHMTSAQYSEVDSYLKSVGYTRDDSWQIDLTHIGYTKLPSR